MSNYWLLGPYEKAEQQFDNNRDYELWIACLAHNEQDYKKAKSAYIKHVAKNIIKMQKDARELKIKESLMASKIEEERNKVLKEQFIKSENKDSEEAWAKSENFAVVFYLAGVFTLLGIIPFGGWLKWVLVLILSVPYASLGFVLGGKVRCFLIPEYEVAYGTLYRIFGWVFISSFLYVFLVSFLRIRFF